MTSEPRLRITTVPCSRAELPWSSFSQSTKHRSQSELYRYILESQVWDALTTYRQTKMIVERLTVFRISYLLKRTKLRQLVGM